MIDITLKAKAIRLLLLDIDGILTDGVIYYGPEQYTCKGFHIQDGLGIKLLQQTGIQVGIISGKKADYIQERLTSLNISIIYLGCEEKLNAFAEITTELNLTPQQIAYMGDDLLDLPLLTRVGLAITVPDSNPIVQQYVHMTTKRHGGKGAVREVCDLIMQAQGTYQSILDAYLKKNI